jgi:phage tail sheath protein FI
MPVQVSYPGVYIQEEPSGVRTITGVSTSVALFVGMTARGPMDSAVSLLSFSEYERTYGADTVVSETTDQVRQFFLNGGRQAYVIRIAAGALNAAADLLNEEGDPVLRVTAAEAGRMGDSLRVAVSYDTSQPEATFKLVVSREIVTAGVIQFVNLETIDGLSMNPASGRFVETTVEQESSLIRAEVLAPPAPPFNGYSMSGLAASAIMADLNTLLTSFGAAGGNFSITVDEGTRVDVNLPGTGPAATTTSIETAINNAVGGNAVSVVTMAIPGTPARRVLLIRSNEDGGRVLIESKPPNDIAAPMQLGTNNGGLEVDGFAAQRPAPTGVFASLGVLDSEVPGWLERFAFLLRAAPADLPNLVLTTTSRPPLTLPIAGLAGPALWQPVPAGATSLANARVSLQAIASSVVTPDYVPTLQGYRLVLNQVYPGLAEQESVDVSITPAGPLDIGHTINGYFGVATNVRRAPLGAVPGLTYVTNGAAGADGNKPAPANYTTAYATASRDIDLFNLLLLPRVLRDGAGSSQSDADRALLWGPASAYCREERAFLLIDPPDAWTTAQNATSGPTGIGNLRIGTVGDHAMVAWPRLRIPDPLTGQLRTVDPAGSVAGVAARIDGSRGVWKAPAGLEATIIGVRGVARGVSDPENGLLNPQAINVIRQFPNGIVVWGSRTLAGFDNSGENDYKYVPVRRFALFLEESLYRGLHFAVFEPNDEPLWAQIRLAAGAFMNGLFRRGAFQGQKASDAYFVKCDSETTTQNDINLGIVNVIVGFAPLKPAEFVVVTIRQLAGQIQT